MRWFLLISFTLVPGCVSREAGAPAYAAQGVHTRHLRIRVTPEQTGHFEDLMRLCVDAVKERAEGTAAAGWLCYREPPGRYWLVSFADEPGAFTHADGLEGLVGSVAERAPSHRRELWQRLRSLEHELDWEIVARQKAAWSTVEDVDTDQHPKARMMMRSVKPGMEAAFDAALTRRTAFLAEHAYPLPIEGFATLRGDRSVQLQVVFPLDWPTFHGSLSFGAFVKGLAEEARQDYARRKAALMRTMSNAAWYDGSYVGELSTL